MFCGIYGILEPTEMTKGKNVTLSECASYQIIERSVLKEMLSPVRRCVGVHCSAACGRLAPRAPPSPLPGLHPPPLPPTPYRAAWPGPHLRVSVIVGVGWHSDAHKGPWGRGRQPGGGVSSAAFSLVASDGPLAPERRELLPQPDGELKTRLGCAGEIAHGAVASQTCGVCSEIYRGDSHAEPLRSQTWSPAPRVAGRGAGRQVQVFTSAFSPLRPAASQAMATPCPCRTAARPSASSTPSSASLSRSCS